MVRVTRGGGEIQAEMQGTVILQLTGAAIHCIIPGSLIKGRGGENDGRKGPIAQRYYIQYSTVALEEGRRE